MDNQYNHSGQTLYVHDNTIGRRINRLIDRKSAILGHYYRIATYFLYVYYLTLTD
jgi:hypothetical protein